MKQIAVIVASLLLLSAGSSGQMRKWVSAYYAGWWQGGQLNPGEIDYSAVTHIIHFALVVKGDGTFSGDGNGLTPNNIVEAVNAAHAASRKIILCVGGAGTDGVFASSATPGNRGKFINGLVRFMTTYGYDGIDLDWEPIQTKSNYLDLVRELREAMTQAKPGSELLTAVMIGDDSNILARAEKYFDQINLMTYDMSGPWPRWVTWHNTALYDGGYVFPSTRGAVPSADAAVREKVKAGIPLAKLGIGIDFYGYRWWGGDGTSTGGVTGPRQEWKTYPNVRSNVPYYQLMDSYARQPVQWDEAAEAAYIGIDRPGSADDEFISFDNEQTISSKAAYIQKKGLGGVIVFELGGGYRRNLPLPYRDLLLQTVKNAFFGGAKPRTDAVQPSLTIETPKPRAVVAGEVPILLDAIDNTGISSVEVRLNGSSLLAESAKPPFAFTWNTWKYANGTYTLDATAFDVFGNSAVRSIPVTVKNEGNRPVVPDKIVYDENLRSPFTNTSWGATADPSDASTAYAGARSIRVEYMAWGAFDLLSGTWGAEVAIDPADYDTLRFEAFPKTDLEVKVAFYNSNSATVRLRGNQWNSVAIPLTFRERFSRFYIQSTLNKATTVYFDNIRFTGNRNSAGLTP